MQRVSLYKQERRELVYNAPQRQQQWALPPTHVDNTTEMEKCYLRNRTVWLWGGNRGFRFLLRIHERHERTHVVRPFISPSLNLEPTERQRGNMCAT